MLEGNLVVIVAQGSPQIVAIGQLAADKKDLVADRKGKAVITVRSPLLCLDAWRGPTSL